MAATTGAFVLATLTGCSNIDEIGCLATVDPSGKLKAKVVDYEERGSDGYTTVKFKNSGTLAYCHSYGGTGEDRMIRWSNKPYR